jgi:hypothetical protein
MVRLRGLGGGANVGIALYARHDLHRTFSEMNRLAGGLLHLETGVGLWVSTAAGVMMVVTSLWGYAAAQGWAVWHRKAEPPSVP